MNTRKLIRPTRAKRTGFVAAAAIAVLMLFTVSAYAAATLGVFDRFMERHEPPFGNVVTPVEMYRIDQGVRIDIIAAQTFGHNAIVYMSVQDISGQNRVTENTHMSPHLSVSESEERLLGFGFTGGMEPLYFDSETNTAYFQLEIQGGIDLADTLDLIIRDVTFDLQGMEVDFPVALTSLTSAQTVRNPSYIPNRDFATWDAEYILAPTMGENFPEIYGDGWISNVAIIDGYLHVQIISQTGCRYDIGSRNRNGTAVSGAILTASNGDYVFPISQTFLQLNQNLEALSHDELQGMSEDEMMEWFNHAIYTLHEVVFPVNTATLDSYNLTLRGMFEHTITGDWSMTVTVEPDSTQMRTSPGTVVIGNANLATVMVTPFGVSFSGEVDGGISEGAGSFARSEVYIETPDGNILVRDFSSIGFTAWEGENATFSGFARSETPIDVSQVTAVVIGGTRIAVE